MSLLSANSSSYFVIASGRPPDKWYIAAMCQADKLANFSLVIHKCFSEKMSDKFYS